MDCFSDDGARGCFAGEVINCVAGRFGGVGQSCQSTVVRKLAQSHTKIYQASSEPPNAGNKKPITMTITREVC